jgi:hypothetical protein
MTLRVFWIFSDPSIRRAAYVTFTKGHNLYIGSQIS